MAGSSIGEIVALSKQLLNDDNTFKGKYMIVELMPVAHAVSEQFCGQTNIHTNRNAYWASWDMLKFNVGNIMAENEKRYSDFRKFSLATNYATQFVHNQFNMAMFEDYIVIKANHKKTLGQFGLSKKGFRPNKGKKKKGKPAEVQKWVQKSLQQHINCLLYTSPSPRDP